MLIPRVYAPNDDDILYHYCDAAAFHGICTHKKIWFCDLFSMNDFLEMHWGYHIWEKAATKLLKIVERVFLEEVDKFIHVSGLHTLLTASCYSLSGDVLSQWRAYADDGRGFAIGFKATEMMKLPIRPLQVIYDEEQQIDEIVNIVRALHNVEQSEGMKFGDDFAYACTTLSYDLASLKNPAFAEEQEIRLVHALNLEPSNRSLRLKDPGGQAFAEKIQGEPVQFRMKDSVPVAYVEIDFTNKGKANPIKEVIVGPKNQGILTGISVFLETSGIGSVTVRKSKASYR